MRVAVESTKLRGFVEGGKLYLEHPQPMELEGRVVERAGRWGFQLSAASGKAIAELLGLRPVPPSVIVPLAAAEAKAAVEAEKAEKERKARAGGVRWWWTYEQLEHSIRRELQEVDVAGGDFPGARRFELTEDEVAALGLPKGWEVREEIAPALAQRAAELVERRLRMAQAEKDAAAQARADVYARARATGVRQVLAEYVEECNGEEVGCNVDRVTIWAMPDGATVYERKHSS